MLLWQGFMVLGINNWSENYLHSKYIILQLKLSDSATKFVLKTIWYISDEKQRWARQPGEWCGRHGGGGLPPLPLTSHQQTQLWYRWVVILCYGFDLIWPRFMIFCLPVNQCSGTMTFWCGSGSADPCLWLMYPDPVPDPAIFVIDLQDASKKLIF
jgi:hypothetical protein